MMLITNIILPNKFLLQLANSISTPLFVAGMPTVEEVCSSFGLDDVDIEYSDADLENLTSYKLFQQHVRPLIVKENPKV